MSRRKYENVAESVVKLAYALRNRKDASRIFETLALSLERDGDDAGAAAIRAESSADAGRSAGMLHPATAKLVRWIAPAPVDDFVVAGDLGSRLQTLAGELACRADFEASGIDAPTRALFCGPSGVGKTMAVRWLGWRLGLSVAVLPLDEIVKSHMGETAATLALALREAVESPSIIFLDEIDGLTGVRGEGGSAAALEMARVTSALLQRLDWMPPSQIVIAATNLPDAVDEAVRRRLATRIDFPPPDADARARMISMWLARAPVSEGEIARLALETEGLGGAAVRARAMEVGRAAIMARRGEKLPGSEAA